VPIRSRNRRGCRANRLQLLTWLGVIRALEILNRDRNIVMNLHLVSSVACLTPLTPRSILVRCLLLSLVVSAAVTMTGCSFTVHEPREAGMSRSTVGQELIDLKKAYESGAINEHEYETKREQLLGSGR